MDSTQIPAACFGPPTMVVRDLVTPETAQALRGPWATVMHD